MRLLYGNGLRKTLIGQGSRSADGFVLATLHIRTANRCAGKGLGVDGKDSNDSLENPEIRFPRRLRGLSGKLLVKVLQHAIPECPSSGFPVCTGDERSSQV
uniref:Uncharacterized protein n=1 Tax=Anguilla anguilla TaxID=7936 RepID=A0A0E9WMN2_ANGAN